MIFSMSCSDFLDVEPVSQLPGDGFYQSESDARAGVYGIYGAVQSAFRTNVIYWGEGRADNVFTSQPGDSYQLMTNDLLLTLGSANWSALYTIISRANYSIHYIPSIFEADDAEGLELLGQARALRALAYFYCVRVWGDVPLITEPYISSTQDLFSAKSDKSQVLTLIEDDLKYAAENCADGYGDDSRILIVKGSVYAILTDVYMWQGKYAEALETSQLVLNNSLYSLESMDNWSGIFVDGNSSESIFEIGYDATLYNNFRVFFATGGYAIYTPSEEFRNSIEPGDLRQTLIYDVTQAEPTLIWKFFGYGFNDEDPGLSTNSIIMYRLADIMLLRAEALNKQGNSNEALGLLNTIRKRAGLSTLTLSDANSMYGDLESAILHERSIELCFEGHRWFDLVRTNKAISTMGPLNGLSDSGNLVWPIHEDAMNENPNLVQNSFYVQ